MLRSALLFLACGLTLTPTGGRQALLADFCQDSVVVKRDPGVQETAFAISSGDCRILWTVHESEANRGVIRHRLDCGLTLGEQAPLIGKLLRKVMEAGTDAARFRTLMWGRLYPDEARDATMSARLALAAKRSADWDPIRGTPRGGDINGWVRKLANEAMIYEELRAILRESSLEIRLATVEKVLVQKARLLPFFAQLGEAGVRPNDKLPFDCQAWFSVRQIIAASELSRPREER